MEMEKKSWKEMRNLNRKLQRLNISGEMKISRNKKKG